MTDRKLLECAARAASYTVEYDEVDHRFAIQDRPGIGRDLWKRWNPLADDGDALRLAVAIGLIVNSPTAIGEHAVVRFYDIEIYEPVGDCRYSATRRAIVRAAAQIEKSPV